MEVVPDDAALIEDRLHHYVAEEVSFIFTTGGTGSRRRRDARGHARRHHARRSRDRRGDAGHKPAAHADGDARPRRVRHRRAHADRQLPRQPARGRPAVRGRRAGAQPRRRDARPRGGRAAAIGSTADPPLRRAGRAGRGHPARAHGRDARRVRSQRGGQVDAAARAGHAAAPACGQRARSRPRLPGDGWAVRGRVGLLGHEPLVFGDLSGRENLRFRAPASCRAGAGRGAARARRPAPRADRASTYSRGWSSGCPWPARCCTNPSCCCSTSPARQSRPAAADLIEPLIGAASGRTRVITSHDPPAAWPRPIWRSACAPAGRP